MKSISVVLSILLMAFSFPAQNLSAQVASVQAASVQEKQEQEGEDWGDDWQEESAYQFSHEFSYGYAHLLDDKAVNLENAVQNEFRAETSLDYQQDSFTLFAELELLADALLDDYSLELEELNILIPFSSGTDVKIGRQVITWGTGDLLFLNDLFAKDWQSFFNGRDDNDLKPPVDAIRISQYNNIVNFEIAMMPEFQPDEVLVGERYSFYLPGYGIVQPQPEVNILEEKGAEFSARLFANKNGVEWALYAYKGFFKSPSHFDALGNMSYTRMNALGASIRMPLAGGLFNSELVHYQSRDDKKGTNPLINNDQFRFLIGYEKELKSDFTLGTQAYLEKTLDYKALLTNLLPGQLAPAENRTMLTLRLTHQAMQQTLLNSFMLFYSPSDEDYFIRYSSQYTFSDQWKFVAGLNLLDGNRKETFLAQMQDNSNLFFRVEYSLE